MAARAGNTEIEEQSLAPNEVKRAAWGRLSTLLLFCIALLGGVARFWNLNWDGGAHNLHPDEWALNQVIRRLGPDLNPHFFFYGSFPIYLYKGTAEALRWLTGLDWLDTSRLALIGRFYAALCSTLTLPLVFPGWAATVGRYIGAGGGLYHRRSPTT